MITQQDWQEEQQYLESVQEIIDHLIAHSEGAADRREDELIEHRRYMWENVAHDAANPETQILQSQHVADLAQQQREHEIFERIVSKYDRMARSPYFGRMDFQEQASTICERFYIGISSLRHRADDSLLIYDWRAPISSMYYDYSPGQAVYESPMGMVPGNMSLKRQFRIWRRTIEAMFDTDVRIGDDVLQQMLAKHADDKMTSIVTSIQREQNQAIRNVSHRVFVVQGPAGSGKTSIALQRVAYLLYKHREYLRADNILLFAPNDIFHDYVSNVLPELGESNMAQDTFMDYARRVLKPLMPFEDLYDHMEYILERGGAAPSDTRIAAIARKMSPSFADVMHRFVGYLEEQGIPFEPLTYRGKVIFSAESMHELFYGPLKRYNLPARFMHMRKHIEVRLKDLEAKIQTQLEERLLARPNYNGSDEEIHEMSVRKAAKRVQEIRNELSRITRWLPFRAYRMLFEQDHLFRTLCEDTWSPSDREILPFTVEALGGQQPMLYEDCIGVLYLYAKVLGPAVKNEIRHVLIDEAQDYTLLQYEVISSMFRSASFTILGDLNQSIHPYIRQNEFHNVGKLFDEQSFAMVNLTKSYRSTEEIVRFAQGILRDAGASEPIRKSGDIPRVHQLAADMLSAQTLTEIRALQGLGTVSIAVICRTASDAQAMWRALRTQVDAKLISKDDRKFTTGVVVVPSYLAKGLEFDAVVVHDAARYQEKERRLLYTVCTRALHHLTVLTTGAAPLLANVDSSLYQAI